MSGKHTRRANRMAAVQFLYMHEINPPADLDGALLAFFEGGVQDALAVAAREAGADPAEAATGWPTTREGFSFAEELIRGALARQEEIDAEIRAHAQNWDFRRIAKIDLAILRLAVHELLHRRDIPPIVSINEAIDLSKAFSIAESKRFVNGILDRLKEKLDRPLRTPADS